MTSLKRVALACALGAALGLGYSAAPTIHDTPGAAKSGKPSGAAAAKRKARKKGKRK